MGKVTLIEREPQKRIVVVKVTDTINAIYGASISTFARKFPAC